MRVLLLGGSGQLGSALRAAALPPGTALVAPARSDADLDDAAAIERLIAAEPWSAVINAAGYTNVDRAESEEDRASTVNADAAGRLAQATGQRGIPLLYVSTDYVFDGRKDAPYVETDATAPLNAYGRSKLAGERQVAAANPRHVILRTAWLYSPYRSNFVRTILRLARERERLTIVADQRGCPTAAHDLAEACLAVTLRCAADPGRAPYGLYHFAGAGAATWFEFANAIVAEAAGLLGRVPQVVPISSTDYGSPVARPADSRLDCTAIEQAFALKPRPWRQALAETVARLMTPAKGG
jgi:dTDP-4-dehydrorhamnose reductase